MARAGDAIENPVSGERIVFRQTAAETKGELLAFDYTLRPGGSVPFAHLHRFQEERFQVVSGRARIRVGSAKLTVGAGENAVVPAGTVHRLWNDSPEELRAIVEFRPALRTEDGFAKLFALAREGKVGRLGLPRNPFRLAVLAHESRDEVELAAIPRQLQRAVTAMLAPVGRLLGYEAVAARLER
jgi:mannose-6-phosphate isomerase-like protein (cupin superfamily)